MKTLAVIANLGKKRAASVLHRLDRCGVQASLRLVTGRETAAFLEHAETLPQAEMFEAADAVMALGGDGTMLRVVRELAGRDKPVIGVNIGSLGFLTSVAEEALKRAVDCLASDEYVISTRTIADCLVERDGERVGAYRALNDVVINRGPSSRVVTLDVSIDGDPVTPYVCDGLIVSTPTGSTGHSLSAGGPILTPTTPAFVISLICPHTLSSRPMVVRDDSRITIVTADSAPGLVLAADGQTGQELARGDRVTVTRSPQGVRFIHLPGHSYFSVLRQKLHWSGTSLDGL